LFSPRLDVFSSPRLGVLGFWERERFPQGGTCFRAANKCRGHPLLPAAQSPPPGRGGAHGPRPVPQRWRRFLCSLRHRPNGGNRRSAVTPHRIGAWPIPKPPRDITTRRPPKNAHPKRAAIGIFSQKKTAFQRSFPTKLACSIQKKLWCFPLQQLFWVRWLPKPTGFYPFPAAHHHAQNPQKGGPGLPGWVAAPGAGAHQGGGGGGLKGPHRHWGMAPGGPRSTPGFYWGGGVKTVGKSFFRGACKLRFVLLKASPVGRRDPEGSGGGAEGASGGGGGGPAAPVKVWGPDSFFFFCFAGGGPAGGKGFYRSAAEKLGGKNRRGLGGNGLYPGPPGPKRQVPPPHRAGLGFGRAGGRGEAALGGGVKFFLGSYLVETAHGDLAPGGPAGKGPAGVMGGKTGVPSLFSFLRGGGGFFVRWLFGLLVFRFSFFFPDGVWPGCLRACCFLGNCLGPMFFFFRFLLGPRPSAGGQ